MSKKHRFVEHGLDDIGFWIDFLFGRNNTFAHGCTSIPSPSTVFQQALSIPDPMFLGVFARDLKDLSIDDLIQVKNLATSPYLMQTKGFKKLEHIFTCKENLRVECDEQTLKDLPLGDRLKIWTMLNRLDLHKKLDNW